MGIDSILAGGLTSATAGASWFFPVLTAIVVYFQFEVLDNEAPLIDAPSEVLLPSYDFIVIGGGSAGRMLFFKFSRLSNIYLLLLFQVLSLQVAYLRSKIGMYYCSKQVVTRQKFQTYLYSPVTFNLANWIGNIKLSHRVMPV